MPLTKAQIKHIKQLTNKKNCEESQLFKAEGAKCIQELINGGAILEALYATKELTNQFPNAQIEEEHVITQISSLINAQGIVGLFQLPIHTVPQNLNNTISLVLDGVQDPGNMGTLIRIADWVGIKNIFTSVDSAYAYAPKVVQASMGSIARVNVHSIDLNILLSTNKNIDKYAAVLNGENLYKLAPIKEGIIIMGSEGKGISAAILKQCNKHITIPGAGQAESLNVGVSAGIICSYLVR